MRAADRFVALVTPTRAHYASLVITALVVGVAQSTQWFHFDEFAFLKAEAPPLLYPHLGHLSIAPNVILHGLLLVFGWHTYLPYVALALVAHLAVVHLLWRVMLRVGAGRWVSAALPALLGLLGAGSENLLWAFQFAFMGAIALGLAAILVLDVPVLTWRRVATAVGILLIALTFAGTSVPLVIAATLVAWRRGGLLKASVVAASTGVPYLAWYVTFARLGDRPASGLAIHSVEDATQRAPEFFSRMFVDTLNSMLPLKLIAPVIVFAVLAWLVVRARTLAGERFPAIALVAASVAFATMTTLSRLDFGMDNASSSRYVYAQYVFCAATVAIILTEIAPRLVGIVRTVAIALFGVVLVYNLTLLVGWVHTRVEYQSTVRQIFSAALELHDEDPNRYDLLARPTPQMAPDITLGDLVELQERGAYDGGTFDQAALDIAFTNLSDPDSRR